MMTLTTKYYYSMADLLLLSSPTYAQATPFSAGATVTGFAALIKMILKDYDTTNMPADDEYTKELFKRIWFDYYDAPIIAVEKDSWPWSEPTEPTFVEMKAVFIDVAGRIAKWLVDTKDRYEYLIKAYKDQEASLLNQLSSIATTKFNDTPQTDEPFVNDQHLTNATRVESKSDVATPMARLKEVKDNLKDLYAEWSDDFKQFIIFSAW